MLNFGLSDDQRALIDVAKRFAKERIIPVAAECDRESRFPKDVFVAAHELGLVNASVSTDYGGPGLGELENALIAEQLAYGCTGIQTSMLANTLALTPIKLGGSDVAGLKTSFKAHGDDYVLNGEKCWITNASFASFYVVFATSDPAKRHKGIAAFIVDRDSPGLRVGKHEDKLGQRASDTAAVHFS